MKQALVGMEYALVNDKLGDEEDYQFHSPSCRLRTTRTWWR